MQESAQDTVNLRRKSKTKSILVFAVLFSTHIVIHFLIKKYGETGASYSILVDFVISVAVAITFYSMIIDKDVAVIKINEQSAQLNKQKEELKARALDIANAENELNKKLMEANKLNKLMVDRELKMVELKKEIASLKGEPN